MGMSNAIGPGTGLPTTDIGWRRYDPLESAHRYINRELSWLDFDARVLALAKDPERPLLERVRFLSIFVANLDEFFQVRVSGLLEQREAGIHQATPDGMTPAEQLVGIRARVSALMQEVHQLYTDVFVPELEKAGIRMVAWGELDGEPRAWLTDVFNERIFPVLTPLSVDPAHPFPYISSLSLNLAVLVRDPTTGGRRFARLKVPPLLPRFFALPDGERFIAIEHVIAAHLDRLFPGMQVGEHYVFRVTRDADLDVEEDEAGDLLEEIQTVLLRRRRGASCVRLEIEAGTPPEVLDLLSRELDLEEDQIYESSIPLDISGLDTLDGLDRPELKREPWVPVTAPALAQFGEAAPDIFEVLRRTDVIVHHPYESFVTSVEEFVETAAADPNVLAIKQTLYRTSVDSPIVQALGRAAEMGKQVVALVELKARFDEEANINWARTLERAGAHVVYGVVGLKTHAKVCLVVRREGLSIRRYAHIGTGNYNSKTASLYEDLGLLTADQALVHGCRRPVQPADGLQPSALLRQALGRAAHAARRAPGDDPRRGGRRPRRRDRAEDEQPRRSRADRRALRCVAGGNTDRPRGARRVLPAPRCARAFGRDPGALDRRAIPGTFADLPVRDAPLAVVTTSSGRPTSCPATWITESKRWFPWNASISSGVSMRSWTRRSQTTSSHPSSAPMACGAGCRCSAGSMRRQS